MNKKKTQKTNSKIAANLIRQTKSLVALAETVAKKNSAPGKRKRK